MRILLSTLLAGLAGAALPAAAAGERWMLMARHGECHEIASLKRRVPDLGEIAEPAAFVEKMRRAGHQVSTSELALPGGKAVEVRVPDKGLSLIFIPAGLCANKP